MRQPGAGNRQRALDWRFRGGNHSGVLGYADRGNLRELGKSKKLGEIRNLAR